MTATNPFEALADRQLTATAKRQHQAKARREAKTVVMSESEAPMKGTPMEEARDEREAQVAGYRRHKARERDELCNGPHGREITALIKMLRGLTPESAGELVAHVLGARWLREVDLDIKHAVLGLIGDAIIRLRIRNGKSPFDDAIFEEPPTAFQLIRKGMIGV